MFHVKQNMSQPLTAADFQVIMTASDAIMDRLTAYADLLVKWQKKINLVGKGTLTDPWRRHFLDSAQLLPLLPEGSKTVVDLGAGAGFPGLVLAAMTDLDVHLIDSDTRKGVFMREAARTMGVRATVHTGRIEEIMQSLAADVITSRALAPLTDLLSYAQPFRKAGTTCLFLKGKSSDDELTAAREEWTMVCDTVTSVTDEAGVVLRISDFFQNSEKNSQGPT